MNIFSSKNIITFHSQRQITEIVKGMKIRRFHLELAKNNVVCYRFPGDVIGISICPRLIGIDQLNMYPSEAKRNDDATEKLIGKHFSER